MTPLKIQKAAEDTGWKVKTAARYPKEKKQITKTAVVTAKAALKVLKCIDSTALL